MEELRVENLLDFIMGIPIDKFWRRLGKIRAMSRGFNNRGKEVRCGRQGEFSRKVEVPICTKYPE